MICYMLHAEDAGRPVGTQWSLPLTERTVVWLLAGVGVVVVT